MQIRLFFRNLNKMTYIIDENDFATIIAQEPFNTLSEKTQLQFKYLYIYA